MTIRRSGLERLVNSTTTDNQQSPAVAVLEGGGYVVVWQDESGDTDTIRFQRYDALGRTNGAEQEVAAPFGTDNRSLPEVVALSDGGFELVFSTEFSSTDLDLIQIRYDADGLPVSSNILDAVGDIQTEAAVTATSTGSAVVFSDQNSDNIELRFIDSANSASATFTVTESTSTTLSTPDVAALANGNLAVVWVDSANVNLRIIDSAGAGVTSTILVNNSGIAFSITPSVTALNNGGFVVTYADLGPGFPEPVGSVGVRAQIFAPDGTPFGDEIIVNTNVFGQQAFADVVALPNGGFFIAWVDFDGPDTVRGQFFDILGNRIGTETIINTDDFVSSIAGPVSVDAFEDGRVIVTYGNAASNADGSGSGIFSQIIDPRNGVVQGSGEDDVLLGNTTNDEIIGLNGDDLLYGLDGNDTLFGGADNDTLEGGAGADVLIGGFGASSQDTAAYVFSSQAVNVNLATRVVSGGDAEGDLLFGIDGVIGSNNSDTLTGNGGVNVIEGGIGNDIINGANGNDVLSGGFNNDIIFGGNGNDLVNGDGSNDMLRGGNNNDTLTGGDGNDMLFGDAQADLLLGGNNNDTLNGGGGNDTLDGGGQADVLLGGFNNDILRGGAGNDMLFGEGQNDTLEGGLNNDTLDGGAGNDTLTGGGQVDTFVFGLAGNADVITDFQNNVDVIDLTAYNFASAAEAFAGGAEVDGTFTFNFGANGSLQVDGLTQAQLGDDLLL